jgi:hypothetical protein
LPGSSSEDEDFTDEDDFAEDDDFCEEEDFAEELFLFSTFELERI